MSWFEFDCEILCECKIIGKISSNLHFNWCAVLTICTFLFCDQMPWEIRTVQSKCLRMEFEREMVTSVNEIPVSVMLFMNWEDHKSSQMFLPHQFFFQRIRRFIRIFIWKKQEKMSKTNFFFYQKNGDFLNIESNKGKNIKIERKSRRWAAAP